MLTNIMIDAYSIYNIAIVIAESYILRTNVFRMPNVFFGNCISFIVGTRLNF